MYFKKKQASIICLFFIILLLLLALTSCIPEIKTDLSGTNSSPDSANGVVPSPDGDDKGANIDPSYYAITYFDEKNESYPLVEKRDYGTDLVLPKPSLEGYVFLGWFTKANGGEQIVYIPFDNTQNYTLYARWEPEQFSITYQGAPAHTNPTTYTAEDSIKLTPPKWDGLLFSHWTDESGATVTEIKAGTKGDMTLTAHWKTVENMALPSSRRAPLVLWDDSHGRYHFIYEIGTLHNVVFDEYYSKSYVANERFTYSVSQTVSVEEQMADSIAKTVAQYVTETAEWSRLTEWAKSNSHSGGSHVNICPELEIKKIKFKLFEYGNEASNSLSNSSSESTFVGGSSDTGSSEENTVSSTFSYVKGQSTTVTKTIELDPASSPAGLYRYAYAGDIRLYTIISYDPETQNFYTDVYSYLDKTYETTLYEALPEYSTGASISAPDPLSFTVSEEDVFDYIRASYFVGYDANDGSGNGVSAIHKKGAQTPLIACPYTRTGYTFGGWKYGDLLIAEGTPLPFEGSIAVGTSLTLYAEWLPITYRVVYDGNGSTGGNMESSSHSYDYEAKLTKNTFYRSYSVTLVYDNGSPSVSFIGEYTFKGWSGVGRTFADEESVKNLSAENGGTVTLSAVWGGGSVMLPLPTKTGYTFLGWYNESGKLVGTGNTSYVPTSSETLTARWSAKQYTIYYNANGGTGSTAATTAIYDQSVSLRTNAFSRHGWTFLGWSTDKNATSPDYSSGASVKNLTGNNSVTLYAVWKIHTEFTFDCGSKNIKSAIGDSWNPCYNLANDLDINSLEALGYTRYSVTITYGFKVHGDHLRASCAYQYGPDRTDVMYGTTIFESEVIPYDHNSYTDVSYTVNSMTKTLLNGNSYVCVSITMEPWGFMDYLNNCDVIDLRWQFTFYKQ